MLYDCFEQFTQNEGSFFSIRMPNSSFTTFRVVMSQENMSLNPIFIKVTTELSEPRYCYFVPMMFNSFKPYIPQQHNDYNYTSTENDYQNSIPNKRVITGHMYCKSVKKFTVERKKSVKSSKLDDSEAFITI